MNNQSEVQLGSLTLFPVRLDFFDDILVPPSLMFPGSFLYVYSFLVIVPLHSRLPKIPKM